MSEDQCREYMRQAGEVQPINNDNAVPTSAIGEGLKTLKYNEKKAKYELVAQSQHGKQSARRPNAVGATNHSTVRHRAATKASSIVTSVVPDSDSAAPSILDNLETFGSKVWSVLRLPGIGASRIDIPPGLRSVGRNMCFLNSVLQCLARAPNLADDLAEEVKSCRSRDACRLALLDAATELLQQLNVMPSENSTPIVDTRSFCDAGMLAFPLGMWRGLSECAGLPTYLCKPVSSVYMQNC